VDFELQEGLTMTNSNLKCPSALCFILVGVFLAPSISAEAPPSPDTKKVPATLCRFTLGAIFEAEDKENRDRFLKDCALDLKQVVKALDECKVILATRPWARVAGNLEKDADLELVVKGKQSFVLKDARKKDISLDVKDIKVAISTVDLTKVPHRFTFFISYDINGKHTIKLFGVLEGEHTFTWSFVSPLYGYDADGKTFDPKRIGRD
jgi:hypothetical protein